MDAATQIIIFGTSRAYNPITDLGSDLLAWWDADISYWGANGNMTLEVDRVISWKDIVAGYDATQSSGSSARPTFSATSFNGGPGVAFDGSDDALALTLAGQFPAAGNPSELWALLSQDAAAADATVRVAVGYGNGNNGGRHIQRFVNGGVNRARGATGSGAAQVTQLGTVVDFSTRHVVRWQIGASSSTLTVDGTPEGTVSVTPNTTATRIRIGALSGTAANYHLGQIVAAFVTNPLSADKAAAHQSWLLGRRRL